MLGQCDNKLSETVFIATDSESMEQSLDFTSLVSFRTSLQNINLGIVMHF